MVNQKPISAKIDFHVMENLEKELELGWMKKNRLINEALKFYLELRDTQRTVRCISDAQVKKAEIQRFVLRWFPECLNP